MTRDFVTLFRTEAGRHFWLVNASITAEGNISICSGDAHHEWYAIVEGPAKAALLTALRGGRADVAPDGATSEQEILSLLHARFFREPTADGKGPFEEIKRFLDENGIPWRHDAW